MVVHWGSNDCGKGSIFPNIAALTCAANFAQPERLPASLLPNHDLATQHFLQAFLPYAVFFHVHGIRSTTRDFLKYAVLQACGITSISSMWYYKHAVLQACSITSTDCRDYKHAVLQACSITSMWYYKHAVLQAQTVGITSMQYYKHAVLQVPTMGISSTIITLFKRHTFPYIRTRLWPSSTVGLEMLG